ncbi:MAG: gamma-glutamyltransferase family protein [Balneolaceae bacterium]|nr:MAG: gamma-glutamyltransferase family protein [Balneolaceae bacterium]
MLVFSACERPASDSRVSYTIPEQPEIATGYTEKPGWAFTEFAVAAANPLAVDAGYQILKAGGSAVDAAIAVQMVLSLAEPQSSGIGGGAFLMYWDGDLIHAMDGRETAPAGANETLFLDENDQALPFSQAVNSGLSVGVPGTLAMLYSAHQQFGDLPWADLFVPAITLANQGFRISPRLSLILQNDATLHLDDIARALYYDENGDAHPAGYTLRNPAFARVLERVSREGISAFYTGDVARSIVQRIQNHPRPGTMTIDDINRYPDQDFNREAMCTDWRSYRICGFPPPSSGHIAIMQMLGIMENLELPIEALQDGHPSAAWLHLYMEAARLAFADRNKYIADPAFTAPPAGSWNSLLNPAYLAGRATAVGSTAMGEAEAGDPGTLGSVFGVHPMQPGKGTSHISIIDAQGRAVAMTTTIESGFGSRIMTDGGTGLSGGFHLNNELTDFSLTPRDGRGRLIANRVEPGKRPRSSMSPTLVFDRETGELLVSVGSPGGAAIIHYTAKALIGMLYWDLNAQDAINLPNFVNYNGPSILEAGRFPPEIVHELESMGHIVFERELPSGLHAIQVTPDGLFGGADPRREGIVAGE